MLLSFLKAKYRFRFWSKKQISKYQEKKQNQIINFARESTKFYANLYKDILPNSNLQNFPPTNKRILVDNFTKANTLGLEKEEVFNFVEEVEKSRNFAKRLHGLNIGMSSGTSGNRGVEVVPPKEEDLLRAIFFARFPHDFIFGKRIKLAFVLRVSAPAFRLDFLGHSLTYISLGDPWEKVLNNLNELKPNAISAPPSFLLRVAQAYKQGDLKFKPTLLISYAESLYPEIREFLQETFDIPIIHEIYKATEGALATSCKYGNLHWNEDLVSVELFDKDGQDITFNKPSYRMLITNLYKTGTPIIRYELNDIIEFSDQKCQCGSNFRVVKQVQGRADDILVAQSKQDHSVELLYPDYFRRAIISFNPNIIDYQVIQTNIDNFDIRIDLENNLRIEESKLKTAIEQIFNQYSCHIPQINILHEKPVPHPKSLKLRRVIRDFDLPNNFIKTKNEKVG